jgi:AcrR family transcriptional regulator
MEETSLSKGERTRQAVMEAAYELFLEQGYAATSMRQIADRAGLALGGIYNHFAGKEAIFSELIIERHPYKQILPVLVSTPANDVESFVRTAAHAMVKELDKRPDFIKLMFIEFVEFNGRNMPHMLDQILPQVLPLIKNSARIRRSCVRCRLLHFFGYSWAYSFPITSRSYFSRIRRQYWLRGMPSTISLKFSCTV